MSGFFGGVNGSNVENFVTRLESKGTPDHDHYSNHYQNYRR